jgi:hypothetical protein
MNNKIYKGNAKGSGKLSGGWFLAHFIEEHDLLKSSKIELKFGEHFEGDKCDWKSSYEGSTISILIKGEFLISFNTSNHIEHITLEKEGDFVIWDNLVHHKWKSVKDSTILTVRWPSLKQ